VNHNGSDTYSKRIEAEVFDLLETVAKNPWAFKRLKEVEVREAPMGNFSVYYKIAKTHISVVSFWDNRQSPKKLRKLLEENRNKSK
jgi:toxin YoeB